MQTLHHLPQDIVELSNMAPMVTLKAKEIAASIKDYRTADDALSWCQSEQTIVDQIIEGLAPGKRAAALAHEEWCKIERMGTKARREAIAFVKARAGAVKLELDRKAAAVDARRLESEQKKHEKVVLKQVEILEKKGHTTMAAAAKQQIANFVPPPSVKQDLQNGNVRTVWAIKKPEAIRLTKELIIWLAKAPGFEDALQLNIDAIEERCEKLDGNMPKELKEKFGIEFYQKPITSLAPRRTV